MDEFITFVGDRNSPTAPILAFMQEAATEFCSKLICCALSSCRIGQITPHLIPGQLILGT
jgi:hypothetical protein